MQNHQQNEEDTSMDNNTFFCPSFSTYSTNNLNDVAAQVTKEQNDNPNSQNDNDDFEFFAFRTSEDEDYSDNHHLRRAVSHDVFPIFNRDDGEKRNSDAEEISISLKKLLIGDEKRNLVGYRRNSDATEISISLRKLLTGDKKPNRLPSLSSSSSSEVENDLDEIPAESYCLWKPKSPMSSPISNSPMASPIKCKKSNSTGSSSNSSSSKRWKFLSLLRRSKSDGKESLILAERENLKVNCNGNGNDEKKILRVAGKKIPVTEKKVPAPVSAIEAFYLRKKDIGRKSYLPYKQGLIGFSVGFNANIGRGFPLHV
ncbi:hypothetical protein L195_g041527 [Trifolium pratense]|uniref:Uncharacterized protein n=1 Tax=Trifolium pratense TaxID=57577 RepID=A0A2K3M3U2_TRIPR|nr:hypothetical protein L195_g041527 [Trifolium pratense]